MQNHQAFNPLSLGEGNTPLLRLKRLEAILNWNGTLWSKSEFQNPTGSFKDRGSLYEIREALRLKKKGVVCASTGNMAASLAAYSARSNLHCIVVVPEKTPAQKLNQAVQCGAQLIKINGSYDQCVKEALSIARQDNFLLCGDYKTRRIGQRSIGVELARSNIDFDAFICPVGNGTVGCAVAEGLAENGKIPMFIGVQGLGADPITQAWQKRTNIIEKNPFPETIASAMNVGDPLDGELTLYLVKQSKGAMFSVSDKEILSAQELLAKVEGIFVEGAAAATVAALKYLPKQEEKRNVGLILTGAGLKDSDLGVHETKLRSVIPK